MKGDFGPFLFSFFLYPKIRKEIIVVFIGVFFFVLHAYNIQNSTFSFHYFFFYGNQREDPDPLTISLIKFVPFIYLFISITQLEETFSDVGPIRCMVT